MEGWGAASAAVRRPAPLRAPPNRAAASSVAVGPPRLKLSRIGARFGVSGQDAWLVGTGAANGLNSPSFRGNF
jgi:hypothetical protein